MAKFSVSDNGKSGIAIAPKGSNIDEEVLNINGDRNVTVTINDSRPIVLEYTDARGHTAPVNLQINVDRIGRKTFFSGSSYRPEAQI